MKNLLFPGVALLSGLVVWTGCEKKAETPAAPTRPAAAAGDDHGHDHADGDHGHHGESIPLGETTAGAFQVRAARDEGAITPGGDSPIDAWVVPVAADGPKVAAVRFWLGTEDGAGSIKARAEIESPTDPTRWHTHAEVPDPLPEGSKLWVEIEDAAGTTTVASFDLKK